MKRVVMLSGGPDSATLLFESVKTSQAVTSIYIDYGQPSAGNEYRAAKALAAKAGVELKKLSMLGLYSSFEDNGVSPSRYLLMAGCGDPYPGLVVAATLAAGLEADEFAIAVHRDDATRFPGTIEVLKAQGELLRAVPIEAFQRMTYLTPFIDKTKAEVLAIGLSNGTPLDASWSCYNSSNTETHCGTCNGCKARRAAFKSGNLSDPTTYATP